MQRQAVQECIAEFVSLSQTIFGKQSYREKVFLLTQKWMFYRKSSMAPAHTHTHRGKHCISIGLSCQWFLTWTECHRRHCVALMLGCVIWFVISYGFIETRCLDKSPRTKVSSAAGRELDLCRALLLPVPELQSVPIGVATEIWGPAGSISSWGWYGQHRPKGVSHLRRGYSLKGRKELMLGGAGGF